MPYVTRDENNVVNGLFANLQPGWAEEWLEDDDPEVLAFLNPPQTPSNSPLSPDQFYTMLENEGKLDAYIAAIETVTPTSKKLTARNQFNNAQQFSWEMVVVTAVMPKATIYGATWETVVPPIWVNAYNTLDAAMAPEEA